MPPPLPPKAVAAFRFLNFVEDMAYATFPHHDPRPLTKAEERCRVAALGMLTQWFMGEINLEEPFNLDARECAEINRKTGVDDGESERVPVEVG